MISILDLGISVSTISVSLISSSTTTPCSLTIFLLLDLMNDLVSSVHVSNVVMYTGLVSAGFGSSKIIVC